MGAMVGASSPRHSLRAGQTFRRRPEFDWGGSAVKVEKKSRGRRAGSLSATEPSQGIRGRCGRSSKEALGVGVGVARRIKGSDACDAVHLPAPSPTEARMSSRRETTARPNHLGAATLRLPKAASGPAQHRPRSPAVALFPRRSSSRPLIEPLFRVEAPPHRTSLPVCHHIFSGFSALRRNYCELLLCAHSIVGAAGQLPRKVKPTQPRAPGQHGVAPCVRPISVSQSN